MSYTSRESASSADSINTYDAFALGPGTYTAAATLGCNNELVALLVAIKGAGAFVQGAASASASGGSATASKAFPSNNSAENCIVVDASMSGLFGPEATTAICSDTQGNAYTQIAAAAVAGGNTVGFSFVAFGVAAGANTVTVTFTPGFGDGPGPVTLAINEHAGGSAFDAAGAAAGATGPVFNLSVATSAAGDLLHLVVFIAPACGGSPFGITGPIPDGWLVTNEPSLGFQDRTGYLDKRPNSGHEWTLELRQRGSATIPLFIPAGDSYNPTRLMPVYLNDQTVSGGYIRVWSGLVQDFEFSMVDRAGNRRGTMTAVSWESVLDTIYCEPMQFVNESCGAILTALFSAFENGSPVSLGTIQSGAVIPLFNVNKGDKLADIADQLATTSQFIWTISMVTQQLFFGSPSSLPTPFTLTNALVLWDSVEWKVNGAPFRNWQGVKLSYDAFSHSEEYFVGAGQTQFTLMRPVEQVVGAYVTTATPNTATGSFSGQPSPGDTITVGPAQGAWTSGIIYGLNGIIIVDGFVQKVTFASGLHTTGGPPAFTQVTGGTTTDSGGNIWTCLGPAGLGTGVNTYNFVASLDNTQFGQILIGSTLAETVHNLVDALNSTAPYGGPPFTNGRGLTFSLPTWENSQINAISVTGTGFTAQQKIPGSGWIAGLSSTGSAFAWSATNTHGGTSPQTGVGSGEPAWLSIAVYAAGTSTAGPGLIYTQGSAVVNLVTPLNSGTNLTVEYTRTDGNVIEVADDASIAALAAISHGTGRIMQMTDQSTLGLISTSALAGLQLAQEILAAYGVPPTSFDFKSYMPGASPGQTITAALASPTPAWLVALLNGSWVIESMQAQFLIRGRTPTGLFGHYKYTIKTVNIQEIDSTLDFWERMGGGGTSGGGSGGSGLVATSGSTGQNIGLVTGGVNKQTASYTAVAADNGFLISFNSGSAVTLTLPAAPPSAQWNILVENIGAGALTISPNGLDLDGSASSLTVPTSQGVYISTDGTNYFSERGISSFTNPMTTKGDVIVGAASGVPARLPVGTNGQVLTANSAATDGVDWEAPFSATEPANEVFAGPASGSPAGPGFRALVPADLPVATTSALGAVKPDGATITISGGVISASGGFTNPMTTLADVIVGGASGTPERLGVPTGASFVQGAITTGQNTSIGFTNPNVAGNCLVVFCHSANSSGTNTISDTNTNTWTSVVNNEFYVPGPDWQECWVAPNCKAGSTTVSCTGSGAVSLQIVVLEYSGVVSASPVDVSNFGTTSASITTTQANDMVVFATSEISGGGNPVQSGSYTSRFAGFGNYGGTERGIAVFDTLGVSAGAYSNGNASGGGCHPGSILIALKTSTTAGDGRVLTTRSTATYGVDWELPVTSGGTVTSIALSVPGEFSVSGSPVTGSGTFTISKATQSANLVYAGPSSGSAATPTFRSIVAADLPLATTGAFGAVKPDGTSITISSGVISASGGLSNPMTTAGDTIYGGTSGTPTRLAGGTTGQVLQTNGTSAPTWVSNPYDVVVSLTGKPGAGATVLLLTFARTVSFAGNFSGSAGTVGTNPTSTATYTVNKNGSSAGTIVVSTGGTVTFTTSGGTSLSFSSGDRMTITAPGSQDATLSDSAFTLAGTR